MVVTALPVGAFAGALAAALAGVVAGVAGQARESPTAHREAETAKAHRG